MIYVHHPSGAITPTRVDGMLRAAERYAEILGTLKRGERVVMQRVTSVTLLAYPPARR